MSDVNKDRTDRWLADIHELITNRGKLRLPHLTNLQTKIGLTGAKSEKWQAAFELLIPAYVEFHKCLFSGKEKLDIERIVIAVNQYLNVLKRDEAKVFSHQSDFTSSVLPEFFCGLFSQLVEPDQNFVPTAQGNIIIDCVFDAHQNGRVVLKKKRVDFAVLLDTEFCFNGAVIDDFKVPILAMELKTNLDKNMLSGIESSVESMKRTFPNCLYFVIAELADFNTEKQNYAATYIDEIYILRKQKRSVARKGGDIQDIDVDLIREIITRALAHFASASEAVKSIGDRVQDGILIGKIGAIDVTRGLEATGTADKNG